MEKKWIGTNHKGVRYYEHPTRKIGKSKAVRDKYFAIRYQKDGKRVEEGIGWASELDPKDGKNWTPEKVALVLAELKESAKGLKQGPSRLAERRDIEDKKKEDAQEEQRRMESELITIADYFDKTYIPAVEGDKAANTIRTEKVLFNNFIKPTIGNIPLIKLAETDMARLKKKMIDGDKSDKTIHETLAIVRQIYNHAKRPDIYLLAKVKMPKVDNAKLRYLTPEDIIKLLSALKTKSDVVHDQAMISVNCGLRFSEVAGLRWEDINYDTGTMSIRDSKTGSRTVFINETVKEVLESQHKKQEEIIKKKREKGIEIKKSPWVFPDHDGNRQERCSKTFQRIADQLFNKDINDRRLRISFHSLRHTFGTHVYENSGDLYLTQKALGHKTMVMAQRYAKMSETKLREAFTKMSDVMQKGRDAVKKHAEEAEQQQNGKVVNFAK